MSKMVTDSSTIMGAAIPLQYTPLIAANAIRLLRIPRKRINSSQNDHSDYMLYRVLLEDGHSYTALSYSWGDPTTTELIFVNNQSIQVTQNLLAALASLRNEESDVFLWVDAICINQHDLVERTAQVQLMRQIYKTAQRVVVWLGPSTPETDCTMQETRRFGAKLIGTGMWDLNSNELFPWNESRVYTSEAARTKQEINEIVIDLIQEVRQGKNPFWWNISDLRKRSWWSRVWCLQELANAREAVFRCGQEEVDFKLQWAWSLFNSIFSNAWHERHWEKGDYDHRKLVADTLSNGVPGNQIGLRSRTLSGEPLELAFLLCICHLSTFVDNRLDATDPRDRVYALLGIATDEAAKDIVPDYTLSCEDTYIMTARALLNHGYENVFSLCRKRNVCKDLPSWVPDWSAQNRLSWSSSAHSTFNASSMPNNPHGLCKDYAEFPDKLSRVIIQKAAFVDRIEEVGQVWSVNEDYLFDYEMAGPYFSDIRTFLSWSSRYSVPQKEEAEWRLPIGHACDETMSDGSQPVAYDSGMLARYAVLKAYLNGYVTAEDLGDNGIFVSRYANRMLQVHNSRPFITHTGHVGVCVEETRPGDFIAILLGTRVPYVLRPGDDADLWTLVGESHVCGIMFGEFMRQDPAPAIVNIRLH